MSSRIISAAMTLSGFVARREVRLEVFLRPLGYTIANLSATLLPSLPNFVTRMERQPPRFQRDRVL